MVAVLASPEDGGGDEIAILHDVVIQMFQASGPNVLSIEADRAANKLAAQVKLNQMTTQF